MNFEKHYPSFFVEHPLNAIPQQDLAMHELGVENKISAYQYKEIIDWLINVN